jgi:hypothetical protein
VKCENEFCANELRHQRSDARFCCQGCRREAYTVRALQAGKPSAGYRSLDAYLTRSRRRGNRSRVPAA